MFAIYSYTYTILNSSSKRVYLKLTELVNVCHIFDDAQLTQDNRDACAYILCLGVHTSRWLTRTMYKSYVLRTIYILLHALSPWWWCVLNKVTIRYRHNHRGRRFFFFYFSGRKKKRDRMDPTNYVYVYDVPRSNPQSAHTRALCSQDKFTTRTNYVTINRTRDPPAV